MLESSPKQRQSEAIVHPEPTMKLEQKHRAGSVSSGVSLTHRLLLVLSFLILNLLSPVKAQFGNCFAQMLRADGDEDRLLSPTEYAELITRITTGAINELYDNLATDLVDVFVASQQSGAGVDISGVESVEADAMASAESFCFSIYTALVEVLQISTTQQQCLIAMAIYDRNRDNVLDREEYTLFVNRMGAFRHMAGEIPLQDIFEDFSGPDGDTVSVSGSKPGPPPTVLEQLFLENLCRQVFVAIAVSEEPDDPSPMAAPTIIETRPSVWPTIGFGLCVFAITISDLNRDDFLSPDGEYLIPPWSKYSVDMPVINSNTCACYRVDRRCLSERLCNHQLLCLKSRSRCELTRPCSARILCFLESPMGRRNCSWISN
jgi:hypothetical protein